MKPEWPGYFTLYYSNIIIILTIYITFRFENEIAGVSVIRPHMPPQMPGAHLRFIPHSINARPLPPSAFQMAPPPLPQMSYPPPSLPTG